MITPERKSFGLSGKYYFIKLTNDSLYLAEKWELVQNQSSSPLYK